MILVWFGERVVEFNINFRERNTTQEFLGIPKLNRSFFLMIPHFFVTFLQIPEILDRPEKSQDVLKTALGRLRTS